MRVGHTDTIRDIIGWITRSGSLEPTGVREPGRFDTKCVCLKDSACRSPRIVAVSNGVGMRGRAGRLRDHKGSSTHLQRIRAGADGIVGRNLTSTQSEFRGRR